MAEFRSLTTAEQVAAYLRAELESGKLSGLMPGVLRFEDELGVNRKTVETALRQLEKEGHLIGQGPGKRRRIVIPKNTPDSTLQIAILDYDPPARNQRIQIELVNNLKEAEHAPFFTVKTLVELQMDIRRIARLIKQTEADAWVLCSAPREICEWFAEQNIPVFAMFGARAGLPIAGIGPNYHPVVKLAVHRLAELGHRRIVSLFRGGRAERSSGYTELEILDAMKKQGLQTGPYNLPNWENSREGFRQCLESLFKHTPPSAILIEEPTHFYAALQFCGERGLRVPQDISLICWELAPSFALGTPAVTHFRWGYRPVIRRITSWANDVARGKEDRRQTLIKVEFIEGGTIGPAPKEL